LRFDERVVATNDFDIAAANVHKYRLCVKDYRYTFWQRETFTGSGGQAAYRTTATEKRDVELLRKKWGREIFPPADSAAPANAPTPASRRSPCLPF
jgi:hypothetical protein